MSRLAAAALRRGVAASTDPSSRLAVALPASARLFSAAASSEAATSAAGSQDDDTFLKASREGLAYGRFYSATVGGSRIDKNMLKTDIIHHLDRCGLSLDDVKIDYNKGYTPLGALLRFPSKAAFTTAIRQTNQNRLYRIDEISRDVWDLKESFDGKAVLLQGVPRNALLDDIERFLCGTNFESPPLENFLRQDISTLSTISISDEDVRMVVNSYPKLLLCESKQDLRVLLGLRVRVNLVDFLDEYTYINSSFSDVIILYVGKKYLKTVDEWCISNVHQTKLAKEERPVTKFWQGAVYFVQSSN